MKVLAEHRPICFCRAQDIGPNDSEGWNKARFLKAINEGRGLQRLYDMVPRILAKGYFDMMLSQKLLNMQANATTPTGNGGTKRRNCNAIGRRRRQLFQTSDINRR